ncbi:MAG: ArgR family transcriptional regulator [Treponema sp.]|jgi:transcriptional regulator of arginine metabolism|nr:ArgR family transcriptional regulator [Treponema sp.]
MKGRVERLKAVRGIIRTRRVDSQETLLGYLEKEGFAVTQATLSRDLKLLRVGKISGGGEGYAYTLPGDEERRETERTCAGDFLRGYVSLDWAGSLAVIRTHSGHSDAVALAVDTLALEEVMGTVSGRDNTVFVALREGASGEDFLARLKECIPGLEE